VDVDPFTIALLPLASWRLYRLISEDIGPREILRKIRVKLGVRYSKDYNTWESNPGSLADLITCVWCSSMWVGFIFMGMMFLPKAAKLVILLPLNISAITILIEFAFRRMRR